MRGSDVAVSITEPTPFGLNDLKLAVGSSPKAGVPAGIVVNCSDGQDEIIRDHADAVGVPIIRRIPFKRESAVAYSKGEMLAAVFRSLGRIFWPFFGTPPSCAAVRLRRFLKGKRSLSPKRHPHYLLKATKASAGKSR